MATDLLSLQERLDLELGTGNVTPEVIRALLRNVVPKYNAMASGGFVVTGTTLDRDATDDELEGIVLTAVLMWLDGEVNRWSLAAIKVSDPAGKVDPSGVELALAKRRLELLDPKSGPLPLVMRRINDAGVMSEVTANELGETLGVPLITNLLTTETVILGTPVI